MKDEIIKNKIRNMHRDYHFLSCFPIIYNKTIANHLFWRVKEYFVFDLDIDTRGPDEELNDDYPITITYFSNKLGKIIIWNQYYRVDSLTEEDYINELLRINNEIKNFEKKLPNLT